MMGVRMLTVSSMQVVHLHVQVYVLLRDRPIIKLVFMPFTWTGQTNWTDEHAHMYKYPYLHIKAGTLKRTQTLSRKILI